MVGLVPLVPVIRECLLCRTQTLIRLWPGKHSVPTELGPNTYKYVTLNLRTPFSCIGTVSIGANLGKCLLSFFIYLPFLFDL